MNRKILKPIAVFLVVNLLTQIFYPTVAWALSGGPSQPEVQSFEPVGTSQMVDLFTGDFVYNIPLLSVDGYPVNISYHGGVTMDQESSWCGLGWNINPGVINRNMRGIPDDFDGSRGDKIVNTYHTLPNRTYGVTGAFGVEIFGKETGGSKKKLLNLSVGLGIQYNNYKGFSLERTITPTVNVVNSSKGSMTGSLGLTSSSQNGLTISPSVSFDLKQKNDLGKDNTLMTSGGANIGSSFNSRAGLEAVSLQLQASANVVHKPEEAKEGKSIAQLSLPSNGGSAITFGMNTYTPPVMLPSIAASVVFSAKFGATILGLHGTANLIGSFAEQSLLMNTMSVPAYGYFNAHKASNLSYAMHDFNREKDGPFTFNTPALPLTNYTYDVYSVSGQGVGGMYRPYRSEVGHVYDHSVYNLSESYSLGLEIADGDLVKGGADITVVDVPSHSSMWRKNNDAIKNLKFSEDPGQVPGYEPFYFKEAGEKSVDAEVDKELDPNQQSFFEKCGEFEAVALDMYSKGGMEMGVASRTVSHSGTVNSITEPIYRTARQKRNQAIYFLTVSEARRFAIDTIPFTTTDASRRISDSAKDHHIGEITALRPDGVRYIYGIPAYNNTQEATTFAIGESTEYPGISIANDGLASYGDEENSVDNKHGIDHYYQSTQTPAYAHSYLLTSVLSSDYIDNDTIGGPSTGDMGTYTHFNYVKTNADYKWRVPMGDHKANGNKGLLSDQNDDKANYLYGEKETWYLESIESKNYIAVFETANRADGLGVTDHNGQVASTGGMKLLKNIKLYIRSEYKKDSLTAVPLKTVHFEYDYSLCSGVTNNSGQNPDASGFQNQGGKLTLKKIYFTYQNSGRGRFSPYEFTYSGFNPSYNGKAYDRWGNYKDTQGNYVNNTIYDPYTEQIKDTADKNASAWCLTQIDLPSGGTLNVSYESDDYAYVQDQPAMQMFKILGIGDSTSQYSNNLYDASNWFSSNHHYDYVYVQLPSTITTASDFYNYYLKGIDNLYFRCNVNMGKEGDGKYELVPGYSPIESYKVLSGNIGVIQLQATGLGEKGNRGLQINPITLAALQFSRLYTPTVAYNEPKPTDPGIQQVLKAIINSNMAKNVKAMLLGINGNLLNEHHCADLDTAHSYVRLLNPTKTKFGGGARVKSITQTDRSADFKMGTEDAVYGQVYTYEMQDPDDTTRTISSGVAAYEPLLGGEENPLRQPVLYGKKKQQKLLVPDDRFYQEEPYGESFFPSPTVGYSKVTVQSYIPTGVEVNRHGTGKVVHEFYTAKDYPVITDRTDLDVVENKSPLPLRLLHIVQKDFLYASQGFVVELNDMHGKPKAQWTYAEGQEVPLSGVEYKYKTAESQLDNEVQIIDVNGNVQTANVGIDFDMIADSREQETRSNSKGLHGNLATFMIFAAPAAVPLILPAVAKEDTRFHSIVLTKVINRYGILEETVVHNQGSVITTKNLAFDQETGELLLKSVVNEYNDTLYTFTYPAHWAYDRMGQAYRNIGLEFTIQLDLGTGNLSDTVSIGTIPYPLTSEFFVEGDELAVVYNTYQGLSTAVDENIKYKFWVVYKDSASVFVMGGKKTTHCNYPLDGETIFKIIRSGRRNQQNMPVGSITSKVNPIRSDEQGNLKIDFLQKDYSILSAGSAEYSDEWGIPCSCGRGNVGDFYNPYYSGTKGNWRGQTNHTYLTDRKETYPEANLREDGTFAAFSPFWNSPAANGLTWQSNTSDANWKWVTQVTQYDPFKGNSIESVNPLGLYSGNLNSYNHTWPVSQAPNARYSEIYSDNFEDYGVDACDEDLSKFNNGATGNLSTKAHSGKKSFKVPKGGSSAVLSIVPSCD